MSMRYTANQAWPFPDVNEPINNMNDWIYALDIFAELRSVQRFANAAELSSKRPTPVAGEVAWLTTEKIIQVYDGTAWKRVYPPSPMVYSGTAAPVSTTGAVGDLYVKTT